MVARKKNWPLYPRFPGEVVPDKVDRPELKLVNPLGFKTGAEILTDPTAAYYTERLWAGITVTKKWVTVKYGGYDWNIETSRLSTEADIARTAVHLSHKKWMTADRVGHFIERCYKGVLHKDLYTGKDLAELPA